MIAHRGASAYELENTLAAFRAANEMAADGVELDIHVTADGVPVVHHDPDVGGVPIADVASARLTDHRLANGEPIPTLAETLDVLGPGPIVFVEAKSLPADRDAALLAVLDAGPAPARYHVHAFDHRIIRRLTAARPTLVTGVLSASYPVDPLAPVQAAGAHELWQVKDLVDGELIEGAHEAGYRVYAWTVDDPARMRELAALGIDGVCTNRPDVARRALRAS